MILNTETVFSNLSVPDLNPEAYYNFYACANLWASAHIFKRSVHSKSRQNNLTLTKYVTKIILMNKCKCNKQPIKVAVCGLKHIKDQITFLFGKSLSKIFSISYCSRI